MVSANQLTRLKPPPLYILTHELAHMGHMGFLLTVALVFLVPSFLLKYVDEGISWAALSGHLESTKSFFVEDSNINDKMGIEYTTFQWSTKSDHSKIAQYLVENGSSHIDLQSDLTQSVAKQALETVSSATTVILWSSVAQARVFINGAQSSIQMVDSIGATPLMHAAYFDKLDWVMLFESMKGQVDIHGNTAVHYAAYGDGLDAVKYLLKIGVDSSKKNKDDDSAFDVAVMRNSTKVLGLLLEEANYVDMDRGIRHAVMAGSVKSVQLLFQSEKQYGSLDRPLDLAVQRNHVEMADLLLNHGAKATAEHMIHAARIGSIELAKCLVRHGGMVDATHENEVPLLIAIVNRDLDMIKWLLENGSQQTQLGLSAAIRLQHTTIFSLLVEYNASVLDLPLNFSAMSSEMKDLTLTTHLVQSTVARQKTMKEVLYLSKQVNDMVKKVDDLEKQMSKA